MKYWFHIIQSIENTNSEINEMKMQLHKRICPIFLNSVRRVNALLLCIGTFLPRSNRWWEIKSKFSQRYIPDYFVKEFIQILCLVQTDYFHQLSDSFKNHLSLKFIVNQEWFCNITWIIVDYVLHFWSKHFLWS